MDISVLIRMANDIANFFEANPDRAQAEREIAAHLKNFWDPSMRRQLLEHVAGGGAGLHASVVQAVRQLAP